MASVRPSRVLRAMQRARVRLAAIVARSPRGHGGAPSPIRGARIARLWPGRARSTAGGRQRTPGGALAGGLAVFLGIALIADAVATIVWRDPITSVFAQQRQKALEGELDALEKTPLPQSELALVQHAITKEKRMALLAAHSLRRSRAGDPLGRISIPRIDKRFVFVTGTGEKSLKKGPGHYLGTALPGLRGTVGIAGHRTTYLAPFRHLDRMRKSDRIVLTMPYGRFSYRVEGTKVIKPTQTSVLRHAGYDRLVLTTCTPLHSNKRRLIVTARLAGATERGPTIDQTPLPPTAPL
jgi:sortase A